jgi:hypothetical protein
MPEVGGVAVGVVAASLAACTSGSRKSVARIRGTCTLGKGVFALEIVSGAVFGATKTGGGGDGVLTTGFGCAWTGVASGVALGCNGLGATGLGDIARGAGFAIATGGDNSGGSGNSIPRNGFKAGACFSLSFAPLILNGVASGWIKTGAGGVALIVIGSRLGANTGFGRGIGTGMGVGAARGTGLETVGAAIGAGIGLRACSGSGGATGTGTGDDWGTVICGTWAAGSGFGAGSGGVRRSLGLGPSRGSIAILGTGSSLLGRDCFNSTGRASSVGSWGVAAASGKVTTSTTFKTGGVNGGGIAVSKVAAKIK